MFYVLYITTLVLLGFSWVFAHEVATSLSVWEGTVVRILGVLVSATVFVLMTKTHLGMRDIKDKHPSAPLRLGILGCLGLMIYFGASFAALSRLTSSEVGMAMATIPGVAYLIALLFFGELLSYKKVVGLLLASAGTMYYVNGGSDLAQLSSLVGLVLALFAVVSYALYGLLYKHWMADFGVVTVLPYMSGAGILAAFPFFLYELLTKGGMPAAYDFFMGFILGAVFTMPVVAIYQKMIQLRGPIAANTVALLAPFSVMVAEIAVNKKDIITSEDAGALMLCMAGVSLVLFPGSMLQAFKNTRREVAR